MADYQPRLPTPVIPVTPASVPLRGAYREARQARQAFWDSLVADMLVGQRWTIAVPEGETSRSTILNLRRVEKRLGISLDIEPINDRSYTVWRKR